MTPSLAILGGGLLGRTVAKVAIAAGANVRLWARRAELRADLASKLPALQTCAEVQEAADNATIVLLAVPASAVREVAAAYGDVARGDQFVLHAVRGVCPGERFLLPHRVVRQETSVRKIGVLGGPLFAPDLTGNRPMAALLASRFDEIHGAVSALVQGTPVHLHRSRDVIGVEVAGAISNVTALAVGMAEALELGDTIRGVLLTHGLGEATHLGAALGAESETFSGLAGVGDLIPRRIGSTERHWAVGAALATGTPLAEALADAGGEVEGILTAARAVTEAEHLGLDLALCRAVDDVLSGRRAAGDALEDVLQRDLGLSLGA